MICLIIVITILFSFFFRIRFFNIVTTSGSKSSFQSSRSKWFIKTLGFGMSRNNYIFSQIFRVFRKFSFQRQSQFREQEVIMESQIDRIRQVRYAYSDRKLRKEDLSSYLPLFSQNNKHPIFLPQLSKAGSFLRSHLDFSAYFNILSEASTLTTSKPSSSNITESTPVPQATSNIRRHFFCRRRPTKKSR